MDNNNRKRILLTASTGVYLFNANSGEVQRVEAEERSDEDPSELGFFGLCESPLDGAVYLASRRRSTSFFRTKKSRSIAIYKYNILKESLDFQYSVQGVRDVHQICMDEAYFYITDTGNNRLCRLSIDNKNPMDWVNIGQRRKDKNHINAVKVLGSNVYIGLNNRGRIKSQILVMPKNNFKTGLLSRAKKTEKIFSLNTITHSHDLEINGEDVYISSSHDGILFKTQIKNLGEKLEPVLSYGPWLRGISFTKDTFFMGVSPVSDRKARYKSTEAAKILVFSAKNYKLLETHSIDAIGQINDIHVLPT